jgi:hypothetical protein
MKLGTPRWVKIRTPRSKTSVLGASSSLDTGDVLCIVLHALGTGDLVVSSQGLACCSLILCILHVCFHIAVNYL